MYLKTHPANPEQMQTNLNEISWLTIVRLARNIICHERNWNWTGLQEMKSHFLLYFRSLENIQLFFDVYKSKCQGYLDKHETYQPDFYTPGSLLARFSPVAPIQIECKDAVIVSPLNGNNFVFLGYLTVERFILNWLNKSDITALLISGPGQSGKTSIAKYIIPHIIHQKLSPQYLLFYLDIEQIVYDFIPKQKNHNMLYYFFQSFYEQLIKLKLNRKKDSELKIKDYQDIEELMEVIQNILTEGIFQYLIVVLDGLDHLMKAVGNQMEKVLSFLREVIDDSTQKWIVTSSINLKRRPLFTSLLTTRLHCDRSIADAQRLLRFYHNCDKYKLKRWIEDIPSNLLSMAYVFQRGVEFK